MYFFVYFYLKMFLLHTSSFDESYIQSHNEGFMKILN